MSKTSPEIFRVLLVEDHPGDVFLLRELLGEERLSPFRIVQVAESLAGGIERMTAGNIDLALLDLTLPDSHGIETFSKARAAAPELPIIVLSGLDDEDLALEAVHLGAQEYLVKGRIDHHLLHRAMRYAIERVRSENTLERERYLLHTLLESIPDRIYFKDQQSRFTLINRALMELFQLECPEDAYGKTDADFYGKEHAEEARRDEMYVMQSGQPIVGKIEQEALSNGQKTWSLTTKMPLRDRQGRIIGTCGISREVTALKDMEERLATERNLLRAVIDNLPDRIYLKDINGRYLLDNASHRRWLGATRLSHVLGKTVFDFYPEEMAARFHAADLEVMNTDQALSSLEERITHHDGSEHWSLTTKVPWHGEDGTVYGIVCISRDITQQKEADENLRQAYEDLARSREEVIGAMEKLKVAHQELRGVQLQLIEAEKMKSIGRLSAGVAHEVKNPLAVLKMGTDFLSMHRFEDETVRSVLSDMSDAVHRADAVIRGLLDFSAPKKLEVKPASLNDVIERALTLVRGELKQVDVVKEYQSGLPDLSLDSGKIGQVFINVLTNSVHAMAGEGELTVRTYSKQLTGVGANIADGRAENFRVGKTIVVAEVDDTGPGIPDDKLPKVFEPFYTTKPTGKGTGLGLSVVKTIIDLHGATIDIRNLPERGARVTIMFQA